MRAPGLGGTTVALIALAAVLAVATVTPSRAQGSPSASAAPGAQAPGPDDVERLRERAAAFWAARMEGDSKAQWEFLEPRGRGRLTPADYAASGPVRYLAYQVEDAAVDGYFATVRVRLLAQSALPTMGPRQRISPSAAVVSDRWVRIGGVWYRSLEQDE